MKKLFTISLLISLFMVPSTYAALMRSYDMASLWHNARFVIEIEDPGGYKKHSDMKQVRVKVLHSFKGHLRIGDAILIKQYSLHAGFFSDYKPGPVKSVIMFLNWNVDKGIYYAQGSAIKLILEDKVLTYQQFMNPGPYALVSQRAELVSLKKGEKYRRDQLLKDVDLAKQRSEGFDKAIESGKADAIAMSLKKYPIRGKNGMLLMQKYTDLLSREAASWLVSNTKPDYLFNLIKATGKTESYKVFGTLRSGFRTSQRIKYLWSKVNNAKDEKEQVLALTLIAGNIYAFYNRRQSDQTRLQYRSTTMAKATEVLNDTKSSSVRMAAAYIINSWHPLKVTPVPAKSLLIDDPALVAIRKAIDIEKDSYNKYRLILIYCTLGQEPAWKDYFGDTVYLIAAVDPRSFAHPSYAPNFTAHTFSKTNWKAIKQLPVLTAKSMETGRLHVAIISNKDQSRWQKVLKEYSGYNGNIAARNFETPLAMGTYEFRIRAEYMKDGKKVYWWSMPYVKTLKKLPKGHGWPIFKKK